MPPLHAASGPCPAPAAHISSEARSALVYAGHELCRRARLNGTAQPRQFDFPARPQHDKAVQPGRPTGGRCCSTDLPSAGARAVLENSGAGYEQRQIWNSSQQAPFAQRAFDRVRRRLVVVASPGRRGPDQRSKRVVECAGSALTLLNTSSNRSAASFRCAVAARPPARCGARACDRSSGLGGSVSSPSFIPRCNGTTCSSPTQSASFTRVKHLPARQCDCRLGGAADRARG